MSFNQLSVSDSREILHDFIGSVEARDPNEPIDYPSFIRLFEDYDVTTATSSMIIHHGEPNPNIPDGRILIKRDGDWRFRATFDPADHDERPVSTTQVSRSRKVGLLRRTLERNVFMFFENSVKDGSTFKDRRNYHEFVLVEAYSPEYIESFESLGMQPIYLDDPDSKTETKTTTGMSIAMKSRMHESRDLANFILTTKHLTERLLVVTDLIN